MKRIICEKKTTFTSLWNQPWRIVKSETEKINDLVTNIPTKNITELNDLINAGAKLDCEKIRVLLKNPNKKSKTRMGIQVRKTMTTSKNAETEYENIFGRSGKTRLLKRKIQLEEINL